MIRCGQRYTETYSGKSYVLDAVDATGTHYLSGAKGREVRVTEAELRREFALVDDDCDDAARDRARWAQQDAGLVPDWDAEERAVARQDAEDRDNWNRRAS